MRYVLTSRCKEAVTIDGLGVLPPATAKEDGEVVPSVTEFDERAVEAFRLQRGLHVTQVTLPADVEVTIALKGV